jgi:hypothetical protein
MNDGFTLVHLLTRPDDLAGWLGYLYAAAKIRPTGINKDRMDRRHYTWQLMVPLL